MGGVALPFDRPARAGAQHWGQDGPSPRPPQPRAGRECFGWRSRHPAVPRPTVPDGGGGSGRVAVHVNSHSRPAPHTSPPPPKHPRTMRSPLVCLLLALLAASLGAHADWGGRGRGAWAERRSGGDGDGDGDGDAWGRRRGEDWGRERDGGWRWGGWGRKLAAADSAAGGSSGTDIRAVVSATAPHPHPTRPSGFHPWVKSDVTYHRAAGAARPRALHPTDIPDDDAASLALDSAGHPRPHSSHTDVPIVRGMPGDTSAADGWVLYDGARRVRGSWRASRSLARRCPLPQPTPPHTPRPLSLPRLPAAMDH